ncbi:MAG: ribonuclease III [Cytophagales bacterium]|nr:ribonuclease III [Cytophagales bacterium]
MNSPKPPTSKALVALQERIGYTFKQPALLQQALTHRSFSSEHYERLEYLGDAVINVIVSDLLYQALPNLPEGQLSRIRSNLVKQDSLHGLALKLGLSHCLRLGEGEAKSGGAKRPSILADALEALLGAVYLDAGFETSQRIAKTWLEDIRVDMNMSQTAKDPKTALQEWLQARKMPLAVYTVIGTVGAAHEQSFHVECFVPSLQKTERGSGNTRRAGEQDAAQAILKMLKDIK